MAGLLPYVPPLYQKVDMGCYVKKHKYMDKRVFLRYNALGGDTMFSYYMKNPENSEAVSEKYISVNMFGYTEGRTDMRIRRENGRVDYQLIYVKSGEMVIHEGEKSVTMGAGEICLFRPGEPQLYSIYQTPTAFFWIHFSGSEAERMLSFFRERRYYVGAFPEFEEYCHGAWDSFHAGEAYAELFFEGGTDFRFDGSKQGRLGGVGKRFGTVRHQLGHQILVLAKELAQALAIAVAAVGHVLVVGADVAVADNIGNEFVHLLLHARSR